MAARADGTERAPRSFGLVGWVVLVTIGGTLGLTAPFASLVAMERLEMPAWVGYPMLALAGALQGLLVGITQALALHRTVIAVPRAGWALITMAGALVAWAVGTVPGTVHALGEPLDLDSFGVLAAVVAGAVVLVSVVPAAQWLLLRRVMPGAWLWIFVESVAIVVGLMAIWGLSLAVDMSRPLEDIALSVALGAGGVALVFALVTGAGLALLTPQPHSARAMA